MITKTKGVLLHQLKYSETSLILKVYTEEHGLQSFILRSARSKKGKNKSSFLQPLSLVEIVAHGKESTALKQISNINLCQPYQTIPFDVIKQSIVLFLNEVLYKSIQEHADDKALFYFIYEGLLSLDQTDKVENFHLLFLVHLLFYLGVLPENNYDSNCCFFHLTEGKFVETQTDKALCLDQEVSKVFSTLLGMKFVDFQMIKINNEQRRKMIKNLITYYQIHISGVKNINSHLVLETVLG